jgi:hypothetical protein
MKPGRIGLLKPKTLVSIGTEMWGGSLKWRTYIGIGTVNGGTSTRPKKPFQGKPREEHVLENAISEVGSAAARRRKKKLTEKASK